MAADEIVPIVIRTSDLSPAKGTHRQVVLKEIPISGPFRFHAEQTMNRLHINWNFNQGTDEWTVATTQPVFLPNVQTISVSNTLPVGDWCQYGYANFSGLGHYETDITLDAVPDGARVILDLGRVAVSAEVRVNGRSAGIVFVDPYCLDVTDFVKPGQNGT